MPTRFPVCHAVYPQFDERTVIEGLELERHPVILQLLTYLFDFLYDHYPLILQKMETPVKIRRNGQVHYNIHSFYELNVLNTRRMHRRSDRPDPSLVDLLDRTCTLMGRRHLRHLVFLPTYDVRTLQERYDRISFFIGNDDIAEQYRQTFRCLCDIQQKLRHAHFQRISGYDMALVVENVETLLEKRLVPLEMASQLERMVKTSRERWNVENMKMCRVMGRIDYCIDHLPTTEILTYQIMVEQQESILFQFIHRTNGVCSLKTSSTTYDVAIITTKRRWSTIAGRPEFHDVRIVETRSGGCSVHSTELDNAMQTLADAKKYLSDVRSRVFLENVERHVLEPYGDCLEKLVEYLQFEDVMLSFAKVAKEYNYVRPKIVMSSNDQTSFVRIQQLRHAIVERINDNEPFVPNDVDLSNDKHAMLIYGLNSAGKSTLLKSIGISVILAQIGMFVPAKSFVFHPFQSIFTKIFVMDNIYKGQSTFVYELSELKHMLTMGDRHSLILCDELTSGTETFSATALSATTIMECVERTSRLVFTTHLHTLSSFPEIMENPCISVHHFAVHVHLHTIRYDRVLRMGTGQSLYGIEIAEAMGFAPAFIRRAFEESTVAFQSQGHYGRVLGMWITPRPTNAPHPSSKTE